MSEVNRVTTSGRSGRNFRSKAALGTLPCLIWRSTASCDVRRRIHGPASVNRSFVWTTNRGGRRTSRVRLSFNRARSMEPQMRKRVLTVLGVLLIAAVTIQMATAAARHARKAARAPVPVTQQLRERHGLAPPAAVHNKSCDRFWCYDD